MTYEVDLKATIKVQFEQPELAEKCFLESDWKDYFFDLRYMDNVASHIAWNFQQNGFDLEGFAPFLRLNDEPYYTSSCEEYGKIFLKITQALEVDYTDEDAVEIVEVV